MKHFVLPIFFVLTINLFGQTGVVSAPILEKMTATDMALKIEERSREELRHAELMARYLKLTTLSSEQILIAQDRLKFVKEGIKKVQNINTNISNFRALEDALSQQAYMIQRAQRFMDGVSDRGILTFDLFDDALSMVNGVVSSTSQTISMLTVVLTPNGTEMNDFERLTLMKTFLDDLNADIMLFEAVVYEIQKAESLIINSRTVSYMGQYFKATNDN